jgi:drug/metabolite transporter (DMT)-like permease
MLPRLHLLAAALLFSTGGVAIKACALSGWQIAGFRALIAAAAFSLLLPEARRGYSRRNALVAVVYAATLILFVNATKLTTAANAIFLQSTAPLYVLLLGPWLLHERLRRDDLVILISVALGMALFFIGSDEATPIASNPWLGNLLGAGSGLTWALTVVAVRAIASSGGSTANMFFVGNLLAFVFCLIMAPQIQLPAFTDWAILLYLGIFQIAAAYMLLSRGIRQVRALEASLLVLLEPVLNPVWVWLVHAEKPSAWAIAGGLIIVAATAARTVIAGWRGEKGLAPAAADV